MGGGCVYQDFLHGVERVLAVKGRATGDHLVDEHAEGPEVSQPVVTAPLDHLRGEVVRHAADGVEARGLLGLADEHRACERAGGAESVSESSESLCVQAAALS